MSTPRAAGEGATVGGGSSVRELIAELAGIADTLRATRARGQSLARVGESHQPAVPGLDPGMAREWSALMAREGQIVAELRQRRHQWRATVTGPLVGGRRD